jgi:hypothetical protein
MKRRAAAWYVVILCGAAGAAAGQVPAGSETICRGDATTETVDTLVDTLFAWIPRRQAVESETAYAFRVAQVRAVLALLPKLPVLPETSLPPYAYPLPPAGAPDLRDARPLVWFQVRNDGRLAGLSLEHRSRWPNLDVEIQRAVLRADSARRLRPLPSTLAGEPIDLWIAVATGRHETAENVPIGSWVRTSGRGVVLSEERPRLLSLGYRPRFPPAALAAHAGDSLLFALVVDTSGRAEPGSIEPLQATYREFAQEAVRAILSARYSPGRINGCPIRVRIQQPIYFHFRDR